jgi:hypothetical protein
VRAGGLMRAVFLAYLLVIVLGLATAMVIGAMGN